MREVGEGDTDGIGGDPCGGVRGWGERCGGICAVAAYLGAAILANWAVTAFGPSVLPFTAFVLIPFDMTARDVLHERWGNSWLWTRMALLVLSGSFISWIFAAGSPDVCLASGVSFCVAGIVDCLVYHALRGCHRNLRMNGSNLVSALADSICFPLIAFGTISVPILLGQWWLKSIGGFLWVQAYSRWRRRYVDSQ